MFDIDPSLNTSQLIFKTTNIRLRSSVRSRYSVRIAFEWKFIFFRLLSVHHTRTREFNYSASYNAAQMEHKTLSTYAKYN